MVRFRSDFYANRSDRNDVDELASLAGSELDGSFGESEQRVVSATADVLARVDTSSALANDDGAGMNFLAIETLYTETLALGVTAVAG